MNNSAIKKGLILNGSDSVAVARIDDAVYRLQPIPEMTPIVIENLEENKTVEIDFSASLYHDYQVATTTCDSPEDDEQDLPSSSTKPSDDSIILYIRVFRDGKAVENLMIYFTSSRTNTKPIFICHEDTWQIRSNKALNKVTFKCLPVLINKPIAFSGAELSPPVPSVKSNDFQFG